MIDGLHTDAAATPAPARHTATTGVIDLQVAAAAIATGTVTAVGTVATHRHPVAVSRPHQTRMSGTGEPFLFSNFLSGYERRN